jgi:hypothetical protein
MDWSYAKAALTLGPALVAGLAGSVTALSQRGVDEAFLFRQAHPIRVTTSRVERLVARAREPVAGSHPMGIAARCRPKGSSELRNPWHCRVRYRSG